MKTLKYFNSDYCKHCVSTTKNVLQLKSEIPIEIINSSKSLHDKTQSQYYKVKVVPTFLLIENGEVIGRRSGYMEIEDIRNFFNEGI